MLRSRLTVRKKLSVLKTIMLESSDVHFVVRKFVSSRVSADGGIASPTGSNCDSLGDGSRRPSQQSDRGKKVFDLKFKQDV